MRRANILVIGSLVAACSTPRPSLTLALSGSSDTDSQRCLSTNCKDVPMRCATTLSIRIQDPTPADPSNPKDPYLNECKAVAPNHNEDMCALSSIDLDPTVLIPVKDLEVQVAVWPTDALATSGCPDVKFAAATGFPVEQSPTPALGGRAYYHPGDETVVVTLGCTDLGAISHACESASVISVKAIVEDFSTRLQLTGTSPSPDDLNVSVGEPTGFGTSFVLNNTDTVPLFWQGIGAAAPWENDNVSLPFVKYACLEVLENVAQSTAAVSCARVTYEAPNQLSLRGDYVSREQLKTILAVLPTMDFPSAGLTIGMVVDQFSQPVSDVMVSAAAGGASMKYLSDEQPDGSRHLVTDATQSSGIFVETSVPFGTEFSTTGGPNKPLPLITGIGGRILNRLTVVMLRASAPK
jgi:hypothetical protein